MEIKGIYFDGSSSRKYDVSVRYSEGKLYLSGEGLEDSFLLTETRLSEPLGNLPRSLYFPDGSKCEIEEGNFTAALGRKKGGKFFQSLHRWENSLRRSAIALIIAVVVVWGFVETGLPFLAERAAYAIPPSMEMTLGKETLLILDKGIFNDSKLAQDRQGELKRVFQRVVEELNDDRDYRLEFRSSKAMGANALALPGGIVILTDGLVELAEVDEEIEAVFAHEVGHIRNRHALRTVIQNSASGLVIATITGDVFSASSLAGALPTMLVDAKFSRDMEREADQVSAAYLRSKGIPVSHFVNILKRLEQSHREHSSKAEEEGGSWVDYLSTHPATSERIKDL